MPLKDHYKTLGLATNASLAEIKKAYRSLAQLYHPDKNPDSVFSDAQFIEIQQAYTILSDPGKRKVYDEERYFAGLSGQRNPEQISGEWLSSQARKLNAHMTQVDTLRMSHSSLHDYVLLLLSDAHIAVLQRENNAAMNRELVNELLQAVKKIHFPFFPSIAARLSLAAGADNELRQMINEHLRDRKWEMRLEKYLPLAVLAVTLILCFLMYRYGKR